MRASKIIFATVLLLAIPFVQLAMQEINAFAGLFGNAQLPDNHMEEHHTHQGNKSPILEHFDTETHQTASQASTELPVSQTAAAQDTALLSDNLITEQLEGDNYSTDSQTDSRQADNPAEDPTGTEADSEVSSGKLAAINDIELTDTPDTIRSKLGQPEQIAEDPDLPDFFTYHYDHMNIGFSGETLQFVEFVKNGESMQLGDGTPLSFKIEDIRRVLGEPDLESEDGIAYREGYRALKFYYDDTGQSIRSAHYFHIYTS